MKGTHRIRFHTGKYCVKIIKSVLDLLQWTVYTIRFCWLIHLFTNITLNEGEHKSTVGIVLCMIAQLT